MREALKDTDFQFDGQVSVYNGKVRDVYQVHNKLVMVATDRISAFDHILPKAIPYKGQVLNQIATHFLNATSDLVPNWLEAIPDPSVAIGKSCVPIKLEMVIRGYLAGHAWRTYKSGERVLCGVLLPDGLNQNDRLPEPIITPATKADEGHDEDIAAIDILQQGIVTHDQWITLCNYTRALFQRGTDMAAERGLILVDTKYEFGMYEGEIILIDEIHTPDSSRYFYSEGYRERQNAGEEQVQLSKEFVREWLMENGFQGLDGQKLPDMPNEFVDEITERYISLYEIITGNTFDRTDNADVKNRILQNVNAYF